MILSTTFYKDFYYSTMNTTDFYISTDKSKLEFDLIADYLSNKSYWAKGRSHVDIQTSIDHSICFGLYNNEHRQVGFARVVSDHIIFAWLMDVFIVEAFRGKGLGKMLMSEIMNHDDLKRVKKWGLATKDAHGLYEQFGFVPITNAEKMMEYEKKINKPIS